ncbi:MAG TPA: tRNA threonylcarbamoyladenosine dehydratase [Candidatus Hydrogenedentes bacterium]|nr:tRNA threonylcarbamoyladenosine dehydratase [Candidatus Hydrogenedentota bacterium]
MPCCSEHTDWQHRTRLLVGDSGIERLCTASVAIIGLGGVGGYAVEAVARAGVGRLLLIDGDVVETTNLNRQVLALNTTLGQNKTDTARERIAAIHPGTTVETLSVRIGEHSLSTLGIDAGWHVIDAIDDLDAKVALLRYLYQRGIPGVASMGAGQRLDPTRVQVADISATRGCPLARRVRQRLRQNGIARGIPCVFSDEPPVRPCAVEEPNNNALIGSISYLPALFGMMAAGVVINHILKGAVST